jgi:two-component system cell cycle sensor histidine kinase/response regulator CckA
MPGARLLVVDDEPALADLLKKYLERLGYDVDVYGSAEDALPVFEADPQRYALVLSDLTLPGMNGEEMIEQMRKRSAGLHAIVSSGYPHQPRSRQTAFLLKPFVPKMLAEMIEKKLKQPG